MPTKAKDHSQMQKSVCLMCWRKPKHLKNVSPAIKEQYKELVLPELGSDEWSWLPSVICLGCYTDLRHAKADPSYVLKHVEYEGLVPPASNSVMTRTMTDQKCHCSVCTVGRLQVISNNDYTLIITNIIIAQLSSRTCTIFT